MSTHLSMIGVDPHTCVGAFSKIGIVLATMVSLVNTPLNLKARYTSTFRNLLGKRRSVVMKVVEVLAKDVS